MLKDVEVFLGLGGNLGDVLDTLDRTVARITATPGITDVVVSPYYRTSPVSDIPQNDFFNAVCRLRTTLSPRQLLEKMQAIEIFMGKVVKDKNAPRIIDIDILLYDTIVIADSDLEIPHPRWMERLFVLQPLLHLTDHLLIPDATQPSGVRQFNLRDHLQNFSNPNNEKVTLIDKGRPYERSADEKCSIRKILDWKGVPAYLDVRAVCD